MASASYNIATCLLSTRKSCDDWKKLITLLTDLITLAKAKQGRAQDATSGLDSGEIAENNTMKIIIEKLNKI